MSFDAFLKIDGVQGESTDAKHKDLYERLPPGQIFAGL
jgi:type VI protein secretion system component Hcp